MGGRTLLPKPTGTLPVCTTTNQKLPISTYRCSVAYGILTYIWKWSLADLYGFDLKHVIES